MKSAGLIFRMMSTAILAAPLLAQQQASVPNTQKKERPAKTWFVSTQGRDENPGTEDSPFRTIQSAVAKAQAHDTIVVGSGTYPGGAQVDKPLSLIGSEDGKTLLQGSLGKFGLWITSSDVTVRDLTLNGYRTGVLIRKPYVEAAVPEGKLQNVVVENVTVELCSFGIYAVMCEDLVVTRCLLTNLTSDGIWVSFRSHNATISCNRLCNIGDQGIWVGGHFNRPSVYSNNAQIVGNTIANVREAGIIYAGEKCVIENNTITGVRGDGYSAGAISLLGRVATDVEIRDNVISKNLTSGIGIKTQAKNIVVQGNRIYGNKGAGIENKAEEAIDARNNWWGDATGPTDPEKNPTGKGDTVLGKVNYSPWKTKEAEQAR